MAKCPCALTVTAWSAHMQGGVLWGLACVSAKSLVTLLNTLQPAARSEHGNEPIGTAAGGPPLPLFRGEYCSSDTYQHPSSHAKRTERSYF